MKFTFSHLTLALLCLSPLAAKEELIRIDTISMEDNPEELLNLSEAFGHFIGRNLKNPGVNFDMERVIKGIRNGADGKPSPISDEKYERLLGVYQTKAIIALQEENLKKAVDYLEKNKREVGVLEIEPGKLQYKIITAGQGELVKEESSPLIHYSGQFIDGQSFGSTEQAGSPITLTLSQTIPGFKKGIVGMKEGEKRRLFVHPELAYGTNGPLPPNSLLIFDVQVVKHDQIIEEKDEDIDELEESQEDDFELPNW